MSKEILYILERLDNLERAFLISQQNNVRVTENSDKAPIVEVRVNDLDDEVATNTIDISDNREGLIETFDVSLENTTDISDCREAIMELYDMIAESEV